MRTLGMVLAPWLIVSMGTRDSISMVAILSGVQITCSASETHAVAVETHLHDHYLLHVWCCLSN
jgi:hypothetical protein